MSLNHTICEHCGFKEFEMDEPSPVRQCRFDDTYGEHIIMLCGYCADDQVAAGILKLTNTKFDSQQKGGR